MEQNRETVIQIPGQQTNKRHLPSLIRDSKVDLKKAIISCDARRACPLRNDPHSYNQFRKSDEFVDDVL